MLQIIVPSKVVVRSLEQTQRFDHWLSRTTIQLEESQCNASAMQGELSGFDAYHKRSKVCYDDGQEEWVSLMRETFRCCLPDLLQGTLHACVECAWLGTKFLHTKCISCFATSCAVSRIPCEDMKVHVACFICMEQTPGPCSHPEAKLWPLHMDIKAAVPCSSAGFAALFMLLQQLQRTVPSQVWYAVTVLTTYCSRALQSVI